MKYHPKSPKFPGGTEKWSKLPWFYNLSNPKPDHALLTPVGHRTKPTEADNITFFFSWSLSQSCIWRLKYNHHGRTSWNLPGPGLSAFPSPSYCVPSVELISHLSTSSARSNNLPGSLKHLKTSLVTSKTSVKLQLRDILQNPWPAPLKTLMVITNRDSLRGYHGQEEPKCNVMS